MRRNWIELVAAALALAIVGYVLLCPYGAQRTGTELDLYQLPADPAPAKPVGGADSGPAATPLLGEVHPEIIIHGHWLCEVSSIHWTFRPDTDTAGKIDGIKYTSASITDHVCWSRIELGLTLLAGLVALPYPFFGMLKTLEKAGRTGNDHEIHFGSATYIAVGMVGKAARLVTVSNAFSDMSSSTAFFLIQELGVISISVVASVIAGFVGLDFRPTNWVSALLYFLWIVVEVIAKCYITFWFIKLYKNSTHQDKPSFLKDRLLKLKKGWFIIFFMAMHVSLDTAQQIITGKAAELSAWVAGKSCSSSQKSQTKYCPLDGSPRLKTGLFFIPQICEWIAHSGFTLPVLDGGSGLLFLKCDYACLTWFGGVPTFLKWNWLHIKADKAAAAHTASEMLLAQLNGNY